MLRIFTRIDWNIKKQLIWYYSCSSIERSKYRHLTRLFLWSQLLWCHLKRNEISYYIKIEYVHSSRYTAFDIHLYKPNQDLLNVILKLSAKFTVNGFSILSWTNPYVSDLGDELPPCVTHSFGVKVSQELLLLISLRPCSSVFFKSCNLILRFVSRSFSPWPVSFRRIFDLEMILLNVPWNYKKRRNIFYEFRIWICQHNPYHNPIINMYLWGDSNTHKFDESKDTIRQWLLCLVVEWFTREIIKFETVSQGKLISWFASNFSLS